MREEEPVLQTCDVAAAKRNWNKPGNRGAAASLFEPDMVSCCSRTRLAPPKINK